MDETEVRNSSRNSVLATALTTCIGCVVGVAKIQHRSLNQTLARCTFLLVGGSRLEKEKALLILSHLLGGKLMIDSY